MEVYKFEYRLECLRLAQEIGGDKSQVLARARAYIDFVLGAEKEPEPSGALWVAPGNPAIGTSSEPMGHAF